MVFTRGKQTFRSDWKYREWHMHYTEAAVAQDIIIIFWLGHCVAPERLVQMLYSVRLSGSDAISCPNTRLCISQSALTTSYLWTSQFRLTTTYLCTSQLDWPLTMYQSIYIDLLYTSQSTLTTHYLPVNLHWPPLNYLCTSQSRLTIYLLSSRQSRWSNINQLDYLLYISMHCLWSIHCHR